MEKVDSAWIDTTRDKNDGGVDNTTEVEMIAWHVGARIIVAAGDGQKQTPAWLAFIAAAAGAASG